MATRSTTMQSNKRGSTSATDFGSGGDDDVPSRQRVKRTHDVCDCHEDKDGGGDFFLYKGQSRSTIPRDVVRVRIAPNVTTIREKIFKRCENLEEVKFHRGGQLRVIGEKAFAQCTSLLRIEIPATVERIESEAFSECVELEDVEFCDDSVLSVIEKEAFMKCTSLKSIRIPPKIKMIPMHCFYKCKGLEEVLLNKGLQSIGMQSFWRCKSLKCVSFPSTTLTHSLVSVRFHDNLKRIEGCAFSGCSMERVRIPTTTEGGRHAFDECENLIGIEYPEPVQDEDEWGRNLRGCSSLRNLAIPPNSKISHCFEGCSDLLSLFGTGQNTDIVLKSRFESFPVHKLCYYQSHHPENHVLEQLRIVVGQTSESSVGLQDCLGMTPLHILAISTNHSIGIYKCIVATQPKSLVTEDKWGCIPLVYAIWGKIPGKIIQLLVRSHKCAFPNTRLNWEGMVESLCRAGASVDAIKTLIETQQSFYSTDTIDWKRVARELAINCLVRVESNNLDDFYSDWSVMMAAFGASATQSFFPSQNETTWQTLCEGLVYPLKGWWSRSTYKSLIVFRFLVRYSVPKRLKAMGGVKEWRHQILDLLQKTPNCPWGRIGAHFGNILAKLVSYEQKYHELKCATSLLELVLWKLEIDQSASTHRDNESAATRKNYRVNSGSNMNIVISNVLPYLIEVEECDESSLHEKHSDGSDADTAESSSSSDDDSYSSDFWGSESEGSEESSSSSDDDSDSSGASDHGSDFSSFSDHGSDSSEEDL